ncbi:hypothetical protein AB0D49_33245 [Streptomyces sp. NPDC048290]|uniref:hypothetical protein n=1 Tax=Streptomyces sp. NPDC048290 TaxID=3155811 RepID=UPI0034312098
MSFSGSTRQVPDRAEGVVVGLAGPPKKLPPRAARLDPFKPLIDETLRADPDAPCRQRHTVKRFFERLLDEQGADEISYRMVRGCVAGR